jgi:ubiquinone/menaquinone biosynthesis C-methylase UbiE
MKQRSRLVWLYGRYAWLTALVPSIEKVLFRLTYDRIATMYATPAMTFMNYGYVGGADEPKPVLQEIDEPNRLPIQLYHHVGTLVDLRGREVLEVGSGRGGGASYVKRYLGPSSMVGMDLANKAVEFSRRTHRVEGLRFVRGDAEKIPFDDEQFDVVLNVESSHCYPALHVFFREVRRVLRPGGHFLYADVMPVEQLPERRRMLSRAGLELLRERDITPNALASLDSNTAQRAALAEALAPVLGLNGARQWTALPGSRTLEGIRDGSLRYVSMALHAGQPLA